jgi:uncharacterized protein
MLGDLDNFDPLTRSTSRYGNNPLFAFSVWHVTEMLEDPSCTHPGRWMETNEKGFTVIEDFWRHLDLASSVTESDPTTRSLFSQAVQQHTIFMSSLIERTPIHQQAEAVRLLLSLGACLEPPHLTSHTNPLHIAAAKATGEVVELLLAYGAKVDAIDNCGNTALNHAVMANNVDAIPAILRGKACLTIEKFGKAEAIRQLLSFGACLEPPHLISHTNLLYIAAAKATGEVVELLLAYGAKVDAIDRWGNTALHHAVMANNVDAIPAILRGNACLTIENFGGDTALMSSLKAGDPSAAILILFHMQKTRGYERDLAAVLHLAVRRAGQDALAMIVEAGVDIDLEDENGKTALQIAAFEGRPKTLEILLEKGASHSRRTKEGWTALHFVPFEVVSSDCAEILLQHGADINAQTNYGKTTLDFAVEMEERQLCEFLREHGATGSTAADEEEGESTVGEGYNDNDWDASEAASRRHRHLRQVEEEEDMSRYYSNAEVFNMDQDIPNIEDFPMHENFLDPRSLSLNEFHPTDSQDLAFGYPTTYLQPPRASTTKHRRSSPIRHNRYQIRGYYRAPAFSLARPARVEERRLSGQEIQRLREKLEGGER